MPRLFSNGTTFFKKRTDHLIAPRRCHNIPDRCAHETGGAGQRGEENPLLPHLLHNVFAKARVKASVTQGARDVANAIGDHTVTFAEREPVTVVEVDDDTLRVERRRNDTL